MSIMALHGEFYFFFFVLVLLHGLDSLALNRECLLMYSLGVVAMVALSVRMGLEQWIAMRPSMMTSLAAMMLILPPWTIKNGDSKLQFVFMTDP